MADYSPITIARFWSKVDVKQSTEDCWPWKAGTRSGYGHFRTGERTMTASRMAWELMNGEPLGNRWALHECDNKACCNPHHIHAGDRDQNVFEAVERGRYRPSRQDGENNPRAKLTAADVEEIRLLFADGLSNTEIAKRFGVTHSMISRIRTGRSWAERNENETGEC